MPATTSGVAFLEEVYSSLDLANGLLLKPATEPTRETASRWQAVGDWLTLTDRMNADRVFFVGDNPVLVFSATSEKATESEIIQTYRQAWSLARPQCLFIATDDELRVYDLVTPPPATPDEWRRLRPIQVLRDTAEVAESLQRFNRSNVESGGMFTSEDVDRAYMRADHRLVADIDVIAKRLREVSLPPEIAHSLIERVILVRYLEDRQIITRDYLEDLIAQHLASIQPSIPIQPSIDLSEGSQFETGPLAVDPWEELFEAAPSEADQGGRPIYGASSLFVRFLRDKEITYAIFARLAEEFNGDLFIVNPEEEALVTAEHLRLISRLLTGDTEEGQQKLFLWAYDFSVVPISLISAMYEHFYHATQPEDSAGTHYTPPELAEFVLGRTLTTEVLDRNPRICDPACGSGTFLVEAYRMLVRHETVRTGRSPASSRLKELLLTRIAGIDLNEDAVRLTAFSLYLAFLNYQTPQDIRSSGPLPSLISSNEADSERPLITSDFFAPTLSERGEWLFDSGEGALRGLPWRSNAFDVLVGNPPWTEPKAGSKTAAERWAASKGLPVGDRSPSQLFLWRTLEMLKPNGTASMLVAASVFFNGRSRKFRSRWLRQVDIDEVVNFTQARHDFFSKGIAPFFLARFHLRHRPNDPLPLTYWTVRPSRPLSATRAMSYGHVDRRVVPQESLRERDYLWKVYAWGNHHDEALMSRLDQETTLQEILPGSGRIGGYGYQIGDDKPDLILRELPSLRTFEPWGPIQSGWLEESPIGVKRQPSETLYLGRRLLTRRGIRVGFGPYVRLEDQPLAFRHQIYSIPLGELEEWKAKVLYGTLLSSLARYRLFMGSGSWAVWHDNILSSDIAQLPVRIDASLNRIADEVCALVDQIRAWSPPLLRLPDEDEPTDLLRQLDRVIYRMFNLTPGEMDLVEDWRRFSLGFDRLGSTPIPGLNGWFSSYDLGTKEGQTHLPDPIGRYVEVFVNKWNLELGVIGELTWDIISNGAASPIAAVFRAVEKPTPLIAEAEFEEPSPSLAEWVNILGRLGDNVPSDIGRMLSTNGIVRAEGDNYFVIVKRNERRFWSASAAREDFDATLLSVMRRVR